MSAAKLDQSLKKRSPAIDPPSTDSLIAILSVFCKITSCLESFQKLVGFLSAHNDTIHNCVKRRAVAALYTQKMPGPGVFRLLAIDARNVHDSSQLRGYGLQRHTCRHCVPSRHHSLFRLCCLLTNRTTRVVRCQLAETLPVNGVPARHFVRSTARTKQELLADGTVRLVLAALAIVVFVKTFVDAHAAVMTMAKVLGSSHSAESTVGTCWLFKMRKGVRSQGSRCQNGEGTLKVPRTRQTRTRTTN